MVELGIDFGSTTSAAAVVRDGVALLVPSSEGASFGGKSFPSFVALTFDERILVGEPARLQATDNPDGTASGFKRRLGREKLIMLRSRGFSPERLAGFLFEKIKRDAEAFLRSAVSRATIGVPADFSQAQRDAVGEAVKIAGFAAADLVEEPLAAALAHGLDRLVGSTPRRALVIDLGAGALDIATVEFGRGEPRCTAIARRPELGGNALDALLFRELAARFEATTGLPIAADRSAEARLRQAVELARIELASGAADTVTLPILAARGGSARHVELHLNRGMLDRLMQPVLDQCGATVAAAMQAAGPADHLVLVGGPMRMPEFRERFERTVGRTAEGAVDPVAAVAIGAAYRAVASARLRAPQSAPAR